MTPRLRKTTRKTTMVLTDRQRSDLHAGIYEYLMSRVAGDGTAENDPFARAAAALEGPRCRLAGLASIFRCTVSRRSL